MSQQIQVSARLLRYYEEQGLIRPNRTASGQRLYSTEEVERVAQIRRLLAAGLGTERIRDLLPCFDAPPHKRTAYLVESLESERFRIDNAIQALTAVRVALDQLIDSTKKLIKSRKLMSAPALRRCGPAGEGISIVVCARVERISKRSRPDVFRADGQEQMRQ